MRLDDEIWDKQLERKQKFPKDRIAYVHFDKAAYEDQRALNSFRKGEIGIKMLCRILANNNYLDVVTEEQAWKALKDGGYLYDGD